MSYISVNYIGVAAAAKKIGVSRPTFDSMRKAGKVPATKFGGRWMVPVQALDDWMAARLQGVDNNAKNEG